jgi:hypothetical protein
MNPIYIPCNDNEPYICDIKNKPKYKRPLTCYKCKYLIWTITSNCPSCHFNYWTHKPIKSIKYINKRQYRKKYENIENVISFKKYFNKAPESFRNTLHYKILKENKN